LVVKLVVVIVCVLVRYDLLLLMLLVEGIYDVTTLLVVEMTIVMIAEEVIVGVTEERIDFLEVK
jgi:hypothetical protein